MSSAHLSGIPTDASLTFAFDGETVWYIHRTDWCRHAWSEDRVCALPYATHRWPEELEQDAEPPRNSSHHVPGLSRNARPRGRHHQLAVVWRVDRLRSPGIHLAPVFHTLLCLEPFSLCMFVNCCWINNKHGRWDYFGQSRFWLRRYALCTSWLRFVENLVGGKILHHA